MKLEQLDENTLRHEYEVLLRGDRIIAKKYNTNARSVQRRRRKYGIASLSRRDRIERRAGVKITEELLRGWYEGAGLTDKQISDRLGIGNSSVVRFREEFEIETADRFESWVGRRFGRLLVQLETRGRKGQPVVAHCLCDCGTEHDVIRGNLERTGSCGCLAAELRRHAWGESIRKAVINSDYIRAAARRGLVWGLDWDAAVSLLESVCHYCGTEPYRTRRTPQSGRYGDYTFNGIDRVDSNLGYLPGNVVTACPACNHAKHTLSVEVFLAHVRRIHPPSDYMHREFDQPVREAIHPYCGYKSGASRKGRSFTLTSGQVYAMFQAPCVFCGTRGSNNCKGFRYNGIDRIDNTAGYTPENCVPCCRQCNLMKSDQLLSTFLEWVARVQAHQAVSPSMR